MNERRANNKIDDEEIDDMAVARIGGPGSNWERKKYWAPGILEAGCLP